MCDTYIQCLLSTVCFQEALQPYPMDKKVKPVIFKLFKMGSIFNVVKNTTKTWSLKNGFEEV